MRQQLITLSVGALVQIREALKLTPQRDTDEAWSEAWNTIRDALASELDPPVLPSMTLAELRDYNKHD